MPASGSSRKWALAMARKPQDDGTGDESEVTSSYELTKTGSRERPRQGRARYTRKIESLYFLPAFAPMLDCFDSAMVASASAFTM